MRNSIQIFFDGGCYPNPGRKYGSWQVFLNSDVIEAVQRFEFGHGTNNEAEFDSLQMALERTLGWICDNNMRANEFSLEVETDSMIVRNRLVKKNVIFKKWPSSNRMFALANKALELMNQFQSFDVTWKRRDANLVRFGH